MRKKLGKMFFDGFTKVFKAPQNKGRVSTIGGVKPKTKKSFQVKDFKTRVKSVESGIKEGAKGSTLSKEGNAKIRKKVKETMLSPARKKLLKITRERMMGGGMMGRPMYKKGSKKAVGKKSDFGMLSVKAGIDNNPKPTQADKIAGATNKRKNFAEGTRPEIMTEKKSKYITKKKPQYITKKKPEGSKYITRKPKFEYSGKDGSKYITRKPKKENM